MSALDRLPRIKVDHEFGRVARHDLDWLIESLEADRAEVGRLASLLIEHGVDPSAPGGRFHYAVIVSNS